ncbi:MAG: InlB B-repeat-containing protein, partial [Bacteroidaceae bacterium]|nr:InlB B-repeat-containing protein [Bacteroidaceae bacterium]
MKKTYLKQLFAALLLLCSTVAFAGSSAPAGETYTLTYVVDGETYQTATLAAGVAINLPAGPAKEGYEFVKWDLETAVPIDIASNADAMLYTNAPCT